MLPGVVRGCTSMCSHNTIKHATLRMQSHTVALDLYVVSIACGVLCMSQSIHSFREPAALFNPETKYAAAALNVGVLNS
jgi:hypothetical protein